jgi:hypothetical protein
LFVTRTKNDPYSITLLVPKLPFRWSEEGSVMFAQDGVVGSSAIGKWSKAFGELHRRIGHHFCRSEARERARRYLVSLLGRVERKNGWQLAEAIGERDPQGVQRLLKAHSLEKISA